jgi:DNA invertase Pin-like site-specific DNA recombinase
MKRVLPRELDDLAGMRAARWFRESTAGQWDDFGPDAQREQQDHAIERYELVDAGLEWSVAASGWTSAWRTATWEAMIGSATSGAFDVLVVGYVSRFLRNLKQTLIAVEDHLHTAGVVVLFADERLLSSDPSSWDQFIREAHEAEAYSRKLSKRVSEGYAAKRRRLGIPGGNKMPYGLVREGKPSVLRVDEEQAAVVIRAYQLAAAGATDWEVAAQTGLAKTHVSEVLTNPIYDSVVFRWE